MDVRSERRQLIVATREACTQHLAAVGFRRCGEQEFVLELSSKFKGWLGLNEATRSSGAVELNPVVGVRSEEIEQLVTEYSGRQQPATITTNIGYIMPQSSYYRQLFDSIATVSRGAAELANVIQVFALPFIRRNSSIEALCEAMEQHLGWPDSISYSLPAGYLLLNRPLDAQAYLARRLLDLQRFPSVATDEYRVFAQTLVTGKSS